MLRAGFASKLTWCAMSFSSLGTLGNYRLVQLLGQGGMGEVYLACREGPEGFFKEVVIKCMHEHLAGDQGYVDLFVNEAKLAVLLQHPNIVQTLELNRAQDSWFIVMEHVRGRSLKACIRQAKKNGRRIPEAIAVWLIAEALQGLHFTHKLADGQGRPLGILHRDVSPDNLLLSWDGAVKLVDFGISKATFQNADLPTGGPKGKVSYMAPECLNGGKALEVSDIYSMGVSLHELLTLELPNCVPRDRKSACEPRALFQPQENLSKELNDILFRALNPNPAERWGSAAEMAGALIQSLVAKKQSVHASTVSVWMRDFWDLGPDETASFDSELSPEVPSLPSESGASGAIVRTDVLEKPEKVAEQALVLQSVRAKHTPQQNLMRGLALAACFVAICFLYWVVISSPSQNPQAPVAQALPPPGEVGPLPSLEMGFSALHRLPLPESIAPEEEPAMLPAVPPAMPPTAKEAVGFLRIRAAPNTLVSYQGKRLGKTPMKAVALPVGQAELHVRNKALGISKTYRVTIEPDKEEVLRVRTPRAKAPSP